jgi:Putative peptidoglycan binding domain
MRLPTLQTQTFFFQVNGGEQTSFNTETGTKVVTVMPGTYVITEVAASGYATTYEGCEVKVSAGDTVTCTITNNDIAVEAPPAPPAPPSGGGFLGGGLIGLNGGGGQVLGQVLGASCGVYMDRYVRQGKKNNAEQVSKLQTFLNKYMGTALPVTGFYGPMTAAAVRAFQTKHADTILAPWNLATPTGIVYRTTLRQINMIECPDVAEGMPELVEWSRANDPKKPE